MGVHHYKLDLVPREFFGDSIPSSLSPAEVDRIQESSPGWWTDRQPEASFLGALRNLLPKNQSWGETEEYTSRGIWGSDLRIWKDGPSIWGIAFRFSLAEDGWLLLGQFLSLARENQCLLREATTGVILEPTEEIVREHFKQSSAARFLIDPEKTIVEAARKIRERQS